jgi:hypothetical protein
MHSRVKVIQLLKTLLIIFFLLFAGYLRSQEQGCTDPAANNYKASATINNGSCTYNSSTYIPVVLVDTLGAVLFEISGLEWAGGSLWAMNDAGGLPAIYRIDTLTKAIFQTVTLAGATNVDWEDLAFDGTYFYIGDFGNNANGARSNLKIYKFPISAIADYTSNPFDTVESELIEVIHFVYSDQPQPPIRSSLNSTEYDCEAMIVDGGKIHLFTKNWVHNSTTHYIINSLVSGSYVALPVETLATDYLVTSADNSAEKNIIVLLGYQNIDLGNHFVHILSDYSSGSYFNGNKRRIDLPNAVAMGQSEGIAFKNGNYGFISNEKLTRKYGPITITVNQQLHSIYFPFVYVFNGNGDWNDPANWYDNVVPAIPINNNNHIFIKPRLAGQCYFTGEMKVTEGGSIVVQPGQKLTIQRE